MCLPSAIIQIYVATSHLLDSFFFSLLIHLLHLFVLTQSHFLFGILQAYRKPLAGSIGDFLSHIFLNTIIQILWHLYGLTQINFSQTSKMKVLHRLTFFWYLMWLPMNHINVGRENENILKTFQLLFSLVSITREGFIPQTTQQIRISTWKYFECYWELSVNTFESWNQRPFSWFPKILSNRLNVCRANKAHWLIFMLSAHMFVTFALR